MRSAAEKHRAERLADQARVRWLVEEVSMALITLAALVAALLA